MAREDAVAFFPCVDLHIGGVKPGDSIAGFDGVGYVARTDELWEADGGWYGFDPAVDFGVVFEIFEQVDKAFGVFSEGIELDLIAGVPLR